MNEYLVNQYKIKHQDDKQYGSGMDQTTIPIEKILKILHENNVTSVLDFGCGKGTLVTKLNNSNFDCSGYDPAIEDFLNFPKKYFDAVISIDVFEHLDIESIHEEMDLIKSVNPRYLIFNISYREAFHNLPDGQNCHCLIRSPSWWGGFFTGVFNEFYIEEFEDDPIRKSYYIFMKAKKYRKVYNK